MDFFSTAFGLVVLIGGVLAISVIGISYVFGLFKKNKDNDDDRLINILKSTVDELERTVKKQTIDIEKLTKDVESFKTENGVLTKLLQGRDEQTQRFYEQGFEAMKITNQIHDTVTTLAESMKTNNENTSRLIDLLEQHLAVIDHSIDKNNA